MFNKFTLAILSVFSLLIVVFKPLDRTPLEGSRYYYNSLENVDKIRDDIVNILEGDTIKVGWAKKSLIPTEPVPLAGYGARKGANFEGVDDTVFVKAVVFDNEITKAAYVSMDLLIVPPNLDHEKILDQLSFEVDNLYLTASHTHSSIGGYLEGLAGKIFGGEYSENILEFITNKTILALEEAYYNKEKSKIGYGRIYASNFVTNRLVGDSIGTYDPFIRLIKINTESGKNAAIFSYAAHATCYGHKQRDLSGDYPGTLTSMLEMTREIDFAVYGAGAVGSMSPRTKSVEGEKRVKEISYGLFEKIYEGFRIMGAKYETKLISKKIDIELREESFRVTKNIIVRPWIFKLLVGESPKYLSILRVGDNLMVSTPCDFSGELIVPIEKAISNNQLNLIINSFNGGYIGYITEDKWYDREDINQYETYTMNWHGPYNGVFFTRLIKKIIEINEIF